MTHHLFVGGSPALFLAATVLTTSLIVAIALYHLCGPARANRQRPRGLRHYETPLPTVLLPRHARLISKYHRKLVPERLDAIIVGSGMGSLMCASLLSRLNWKVLVLEQHTEVGGGTHEFHLDGVVHQSGIHYVGDVHELDKLWSLVSMNKIIWHLLGKGNGLVYDEVHVDSERYCFAQGAENWLLEMVRHFPLHKAALRKYLNLLQYVTGWRARLYFVSRILRSGWMEKLVRNVLLKHYIQFYVTSSVEQVLEREVTSNTKLIKALCGQFGNYGVLPAHASFLTHACMVQHYMKGGYYPVGGSRQLAHSLLPIIHCAGGHVMTGLPVQRIVLDETGSRATGVQMLNGDILHAAVVVSGVGLQNTWCKLLAKERLISEAWRLQCHVKSLQATTSFVYLFLKLRGSHEELGIRDCNIWHYPGPHLSYGELLKRHFEAPLDPSGQMPLFVASNSAKDPSWKQANVSTLIVLTLAKNEWFDRWRDTHHGSRPAAYLDFKARLGLKMFAQMQQIYPKIRTEDILSEHVATPLTTGHFIASFACDSYGLDNVTAKHQDQNRDLFRPQTPITGLYVTGQDVVSTGVSGAAMSGLLTAHAICGYGTWGDVFSLATGSERSLLTDLEPLLVEASAATISGSSLQRTKAVPIDDTTMSSVTSNKGSP